MLLLPGKPLDPKAVGEDAPHEAAVVLVLRVPDGLLLGQGLGSSLPPGGGVGMSASCCEGAASKYAAVIAWLVILFCLRLKKDWSEHAKLVEPHPCLCVLRCAGGDC